MTKEEARRKAKSLLKVRQEVDENLIVTTFNTKSYYTLAKNILAFYPLKSEPKILGLVKLALDEGKKVYFPKCVDSNLEFVRYKESSVFEKANKGVFEISNCTEVFDISTDETTLVLVPALAYKPDLSRLGRGGGYYDRFLASIHGLMNYTRVGLCYKCQLNLDFETEDHDQKVDTLISL